MSPLRAPTRAGLADRRLTTRNRSGQNVGGVRPTQLIYTYGVGSAVDLPQLSAMVMGLDDWPAADMEEMPRTASASAGLAVMSALALIFHVIAARLFSRIQL